MTTRLPEVPQTPSPQLPSSPVPAGQVPEQARGLLARLGRFGKQLWAWIPKPTSLAAKIALLTAVLLIALVAVVWCVFVFDPVHVPWQHWLGWPRIAAVCGLVVMIPLVAYRAVRMFTEGDASPYSDIDYAWKVGLQALADNGLSIDSIPVFLVLGSNQPQREQAMVASPAAGFRVRETPEGPAPLHWYANPDGIYLFCADVGSSSAVAARAEKHRDDLSRDRSSAAGSPSGSIALPHGEEARQLERLRFVCQLLRRARRPFCPLNGVISMLPYAVLGESPQNVESLARAIRADLTAVLGELQLRCPVTALMVDLERKQGFRELIRRSQNGQAAAAFGHAFDARCLSGRREITAFCSHLIGVFEDRVYSLFRDPGALSHPGNTHLYELLAQIRYEYRERLTALLAGGFGYDLQLHPGDPPVPFSGCFFAATGSGPGRRAFIEGIFERLVAEQESVEWSSIATRRDRRQRRMAFAFTLLGAVAAVALAGMLLVKFAM